MGTRNNQKPDTCSPLHGTCFDLDEEGLLAAVNILVDYALRIVAETPSGVSFYNKF